VNSLAKSHTECRPLRLDLDEWKVCFGTEEDFEQVNSGSKSEIPAFSEGRAITRVSSIDLHLLGAESNVISVKESSSLPSNYLNREDTLLICGNDWDRRIYQHLGCEPRDVPKLAFVIYDLIPYQFTNYAVDINTASRFAYWISDVAQRADHLFFISKYTQEQFENMLQERGIISNAKLSVIDLPPGVIPNGDVEEPEFSGELEGGFILVVGTIESRKNHKVLISAAREAAYRKESFPQLLFVGSAGWGTRELLHDLNADESLRGKILHKEGVSDAKLRWLYSKCQGVAYPSITEGLGLPILEAKLFQKPIVTSNLPVYDEMNHPCRVSLSPYDVVAWKFAIQAIATMDCLSVDWSVRRLQTWEDCAETIVNAIESVGSP